MGGFSSTAKPAYIKPGIKIPSWTRAPLPPTESSDIGIGGLEWSSELRFLNGSRWVDLLQWSGTERRMRR